MSGDGIGTEEITYGEIGERLNKALKNGWAVEITPSGGVEGEPAYSARASKSYDGSLEQTHAFDDDPDVALIKVLVQTREHDAVTERVRERLLAFSIHEGTPLGDTDLSRIRGTKKSLRAVINALETAIAGRDPLDAEVYWNGRKTIIKADLFPEEEA